MKNLSRLGLALLFLSYPSADAQEFIPDTIQNLSDKDKAIYLNERADDHSDLDSMLIFTNEAIQYAAACTCDSLYLASNFNKAYFQYHSGKYKEAINQLHFVDSLNSPRFSDHYHLKTLGLFADVYSYIDEQKKGLEYTEKQLEFAKELNDSMKIADAYYNLGYMYNVNNMLEKAKDYHTKALETYLAVGADYKKLFPVYTGLRETSTSYEEFKMYDEKCFSLIADDDFNSITYLHVTASTLLLDNNFNVEEAKRRAVLGLTLADSINYIPLKKIALYNLGFIENKLGNHKEAIPYFEESMSTIESSSQSYSLLLNGLSEAYAKTENYKKALEYKNKIIQLKDSIHESQSVDKFAEFDVQFKTAEKDIEIAQQELEIAKQKNTRTNWIFGSVAMFLIALGLFQWYTNRQKRKKIAVEAELQQEQEINDLRSKFLGNIAHEIRTPLTLISGNLNLALDNFDQGDKAKRNIKIALENSEKVTQNANEILELLKFEKNKTTIKKVPSELENTLKRIVLSFKSLAEMKHLNLTYHSSIPPSYGTELDLEKTEKIINNLISNAIKYSPSNKDITVTAAVNNEILRLEVIDFGEGIHYDETEKIFERFYQSTKNKAIGGIGIGLSLSREFAELLDGSLKVSSELEVGSTFTLILPVPNIGTLEKVVTKVSQEEKNPIPATDTFNKTLIPLRKAKILIAEDHPQMATYLKEILSETYDCTLAFDGKEALQKMKDETFDLITSDIMMPKLDGFQFRERLNEIPAFKNIPFILISAKTLEDDKIRGFKLGIDDYIVKPFNKNELIARIDNLLVHKKSREEWQLQNQNLVNDTESSDQKLLKTIENLVIENLSNENFKIKELADGVNYSQRQLTRILKQYSGMTPVQFILEIRLQKAYQLLQHKTFFTLSEVRYDVGITSSPYFNKKFKQRFGINPSELLS